MLNYTFKEFEDTFESRLFEYLIANKDDTPISFLNQQKENYSKYKDSLVHIENELKKYGDLDVKNIFLPNSVFEELMKISVATYNYIKVEQKYTPINFQFQTIEKYFGININLSKNFSSRIDFEKLKERIKSVNRILEFIESNYQVFEKELSPNFISELVEQDNPLKGLDEKLVEVESIGSETKRRADLKKTILEKIDYYLNYLKKYLSNEDYILLTDSLLEFYLNDKLLELDRQIMFSKVNRKIVGCVLKKIYFSIKAEELSIDFFMFAKHNINLFAKYEIEKVEFRQSKFYKLFTDCSFI